MLWVLKRTVSLRRFFEHTKHMLKIIGKKKITILRRFFCCLNLSLPFVIYLGQPMRWASSQKTVFVVSDRARFKPVSSATETSWKIEISPVASLAQAGLHHPEDVFSRPGSDNVNGTYCLYA